MVLRSEGSGGVVLEDHVIMVGPDGVQHLDDLVVKMEVWILLVQVNVESPCPVDLWPR